MSMDRQAALAKIEQAMVRIRRSQTRRAIGRLMERETGRSLEASHSFVVDAMEEASAENDREPTVGAVAERLGVDPSRASRMVASAVKAGFVKRVASQGDGRRILLRLTSRGLACAREARNFRIAFFGRLVENWTDRDCQEFARLLSRFTESTPENASLRTSPRKRK
jgi:DNA-binding MarR family transcriptional regulator